MAAAHDKWKALAALMEAGADVNAAAYERADALGALLRTGQLDLELRDREGRSAAEHARRDGACAAMLEQFASG